MLPGIVLRLPDVICAGADFDVEIDINTAGPTTIKGIEATLRGLQGWTLGGGKNQRRKRLVYPEIVARFCDAGVLQEGTSTFPVRFTLPLDLPPSHHILPAFARLELAVHVSIPWGFDWRERFELPVRMPRATAPVIRIPTVAIGRSGTNADSPRIELALPSTRLIVGETVTGSCAVFHLDDARPREVELTLAPSCALVGNWFDKNRRGDSTSLTITLPAGTAGTAVPFRFAIPPDAAPTFAAATHGLTWSLIASTGGGFGRKVSVEVPLELLDASAAATTAPATVLPQLADQRVATAFAQYADGEGWQVAPASDDRAIAIAHQLGATRVELAYDYRGKAGTFVLTTLHPPSLGLDLAVTQARPVRDALFADIECGLPAWDRRHHVTARSADQTAPALRAVVPALIGCKCLGTLVRWDDDELAFEVAVTDVELADLVGIGADLARLAPALEAAAAAVAPPSGVVAEVAAWRELAAWLGGALVPGDLSIGGALDKVPVDVRLVWDDRARAIGVRAAVGSQATTGATLADTAFELARPWADALGHPAAERAVGALAIWPKDVVDLRVRDGVAAATYQLAADAAGAAGAAADRTADAGRVRALVESLRALLVALEPGAGPYR